MGIKYNWIYPNYDEKQQFFKIIRNSKNNDDSLYYYLHYKL